MHEYPQSGIKAKPWNILLLAKNVQNVWYINLHQRQDQALMLQKVCAQLRHYTSALWEMCHTEHPCVESVNICWFFHAGQELGNSGEEMQNNTTVKKAAYQLAHTLGREGNCLLFLLYSLVLNACLCILQSRAMTHALTLHPHTYTCTYLLITSPVYCRIP